MPTSKTSKDAAEETSAANPDTQPAASTGPQEPTSEPSGGPEPGVYEYTHSADCVYPQVPLTARAARPARDPDSDIPGDEGEPAVTATVFDWPFGPPDDGRWTKTRKKPTQGADNEPALSEE